MKYFIFASGIAVLILMSNDLGFPDYVTWFWWGAGAIGLLATIYNDATRHDPRGKAQDEYLRRNESNWLRVIAIGVIAYIIFRIIGQ